VTAASEKRVAYLNVKVPADAKVYLQDQRMALTGTQRRYVTPVLSQGEQHLYNVRVEVERNGKTLTKTTTASVVAGQEIEVTVSFDEKSNDRVATITSASSR
jgi:uncharacterized protein (TIGR03000 family)